MFILCIICFVCFLLTMQSYGDFLPIPRKISDSSPTCMDERHIFGQIAEIGQKVVQFEQASPHQLLQSQSL